MKQTLVIGSTCADITIDVPSVPAAGDDVNILQQRMNAGGCAYNVSDILRQAGIPYMLCSPVGTGLYGQFVESYLAEKGIPVFAHINTLDNGCCYCIVDSSGQRTFLSKHGAEYRFSKGWFQDINWDDVDSIYFCGLEVEDENGRELVSFIEETKELFDTGNRDLAIYFAPGPRAVHIDTSLLKRIFACKPIIHLNETEAAGITGVASIEEAARMIHGETCNSVIITRGEKGAFCFDHAVKKGFPLAGFKANAVDTTGAGDAHCGIVIASIKQGYPLIESVLRANKFSSVLVTYPGSTMPEDMFKKALL